MKIDPHTQIHTHLKHMEVAMDGIRETYASLAWSTSMGSSFDELEAKLSDFQQEAYAAANQS